tara:strand:- start:1301 stop:1696 length:396 start_codon:yes stop_codon:yes gene_type:complete
MSYEKNKPQTNWVTYTIDGVAYELAPELLDGVEQCLSETDALERATERKNWNSNKTTRQLLEIRKIRNQLLQNTDWKVTMAKEKGTTLSSGFKTWRDNLRKIPQDYTTETKYDELLARDDDGNLTHSVWSE